jgi:hypothetical protein
MNDLKQLSARWYRRRETNKRTVIADSPFTEIHITPVFVGDTWSADMYWVPNGGTIIPEEPNDT